MWDPCAHLTIGAAFDQVNDSDTGKLYRDAVRRTLPKLFPAHFLECLGGSGSTQEDRVRRFEEKWPLMVWSPPQPLPFNMSFLVLSRYRSNSFKFFFDMISRWLVPGKRLNVVLVYASDFRIAELGPQTYTICEVMIHLENQDELVEIHRNLPIIESEIKLGLESAYYARRILEVRGLAADEKTAQIQEHIAHLVKKLPRVFESDVFSEIQHLLVSCRAEFKEARSVHHLSRIISVNYVFCRLLRKSQIEAPQKRYLLLKVMNGRLRTPAGQKKVLGVVVGVNILREKEVFEESHLLRALHTHLPGIQLVEGSSIANRRDSEKLCTLYLEIEKSNGTEFSLQEIRDLRRDLPADLKGRIEQPMHPLFNPRNEEEIMRNVLALANQIKFVRDIPQVYVSFDEQTYSHLFFTVILVRVLRPKDPPVEDLFRDSNLEYIHDRCRFVGLTRKKYPKEATVFRLKLDKEDFLRHDYSIDLSEARQRVVAELISVVGEIRDYNGGMISKQNELLATLRQIVQREGYTDSLLLDNFFYSLTPVIMRSVMEPIALKRLYLMMIAVFNSAVPATERLQLAIQEDPEFLYATILYFDRRVVERLNQAIRVLDIAATSLAIAHVVSFDTPCIGYVYRCKSSERRRVFCEALKQAVKSVSERPHVNC